MTLLLEVVWGPAEATWLTLRGPPTLWQLVQASQAGRQPRKRAKEQKRPRGLGWTWYTIASVASCQLKFTVSPQSKGLEVESTSWVELQSHARRLWTQSWAGCTQSPTGCPLVTTSHAPSTCKIHSSPLKTPRVLSIMAQCSKSRIS